MTPPYIGVYYYFPFDYTAKMGYIIAWRVRL